MPYLLLEASYFYIVYGCFGPGQIKKNKPL